MSDLTHRERIVQSTSANRMIDTVSPIYENSYVGSWLFEDIGREWDRLWKIIDEMPDQLFPQTVTWLITITNTRREAVSLSVYDQTPIARNADISVTVEELSGGQRDKDNGIVTWKLNLNPGEKRELLLQYKVKYPKNERLVVE